MEDVTTLNPHLVPIKKEAIYIMEQIADFEKKRGISPVYIKFPPSAWQRGMSHYCGLIVLIEFGISHFELDV